MTSIDTAQLAQKSTSGRPAIAQFKRLPLYKKIIFLVTLTVLLAIGLLNVAVIILALASFMVDHTTLAQIPYVWELMQMLDLD